MHPNSLTLRPFILDLIQLATTFIKFLKIPLRKLMGLKPYTVLAPSTIRIIGHGLKVTYQGSSCVLHPKLAHSRLTWAYLPRGNRGVKLKFSEIRTQMQLLLLFVTGISKKRIGIS